MVAANIKIHWSEKNIFVRVDASDIYRAKISLDHLILAPVPFQWSSQAFIFLSWRRSKKFDCSCGWFCQRGLLINKLNRKWKVAQSWGFKNGFGLFLLNGTFSLGKNGKQFLNAHWVAKLQEKSVIGIFMEKNNQQLNWLTKFHLICAASHLVGIGFFCLSIKIVNSW